MALDPFTATSVQKLFFLFPISADGRRGLFPRWGPSQSFGFYLLPSPVRRFVRATICPCTPFFTHLVTKCKHLLVCILTWICLTYITILLMVILWRLTNSNTRGSRNSLFLFSQWETTWQYVHYIYNLFRLVHCVSEKCFHHSTTSLLKFSFLKGHILFLFGSMSKVKDVYLLYLLDHFCSGATWGLGTLNHFYQFFPTITWFKCIPLLKFSSVKFHLCWNIKLGSYESALSCITSWSEMQNQGRRDFIAIGAFHYVHVVKFILWTVIGCWSSEWIYWCVCVYMYVYNIYIYIYIIYIYIY